MREAKEIERERTLAISSRTGCIPQTLAGKQVNLMASMSTHGMSRSRAKVGISQLTMAPIGLTIDSPTVEDQSREECRTIDPPGDQVGTGAVDKLRAGEEEAAGGTEEA